jgi:hypothetical protein
MKYLWVSIILLFYLLVSYSLPVRSQNNEVYPDSVNKKRLNTVIYTSVGLYTTTLGVLYYGWYKDNGSSTFHWYNDNKGWLQVDKVGHATTSYIMSDYAFWSLRWTGVENNKAALYAGIMGWSAMTVIEILDGFTTNYGASTGDLLANTAGAALFTGQQLLWKEQRIRLKFSYHPTDFPNYRPDLLGETGLQSMLKDYNGQTYWLSANINSFLKEESKFPSWINVSFGYGATGMLGTYSNPPDYNGVPLPYHKRTRQYYFSLDVDWTRIQTNSAFLRFTFKAFSFIKIPFPTLEYNNNQQFVFHWMYF